MPNSAAHLFVQQPGHNKMHDFMLTRGECRQSLSELPHLTLVHQRRFAALDGQADGVEQNSR